MEKILKNKDRIEWIDIAKGFCIFLVVLGHTGIPKLLSAWIWSFHMPLFFFVSGILFNSSKYSTLKFFFNNRLKTLIRPYIIFSIVVFIWSKFLNYNLLSLKFYELYAGWQGMALWFIPVLFSTEIFFYTIKKYFKHVPYILLTLLILSIIGYVCYLNSFHLPFKLEVVLTSVLFYGIGNLSGKYIIYFFEKTKLIILIFDLIILFILSLWISVINKPVLDMAFNIIGHYFTTYFGAFLGISFMFVISVLLSRISTNFIDYFKKIISYLGRNTFVILAFHQIVLMNLKMIFERFSIPYYLNTGIRHLIMWSILFLLSLSINNYCPWVLGKKK